MLVFRNEIPVHSSMTLNDFFELTKIWIQKSPHTAFTEKNFEQFDTNKKIYSDDQKEFFESKLFQSDKIEIAGIKYAKKENSNEWITSVVFNISRSVIAIEIDCASSTLGEILPQVKIPHIMRKLIKWSGQDGFLRVSPRPYNLRQYDIKKATSIMLGNSNQKKPIVYLAATYNNTHVVNPHKLAGKLFGLAHVIVEPNKEFGERLALDVGNKRPALGRIGIYFPNSSRYEFMQRYDDEHDAFIDKIQHRIVNITKMASIEETCSWYFLERCIDMHNLELLKKKNEKEYADFSETFEAINKNLEAENRRLKTENQFLVAENQRLTQESQSQNSLLCSGEENEFYQGETLSLILEILKSENSQCELRRLRRRHLIESILKANPIPRKRDDLKGRIKDILSNWQNKNSDRSQLKELGFSFEEDGKHIKLTWYGDSRYTITLSKTPSDFRSGKNNASDAIRLLF